MFAARLRPLEHPNAHIGSETQIVPLGSCSAANVATYLQILNCMVLYLALSPSFTFSLSLSLLFFSVTTQPS